MAAAPVDLVIVKGEDWTVQIQCLDQRDEPRSLVAPARMDVKDGVGGTLISLTTEEGDPDPLVIPEISVSNESGIIQLHIPRSVSQNFNTGRYVYDLWVNHNDDNQYAGTQANPETSGSFTVMPRVTESF